MRPRSAALILAFWCLATPVARADRVVLVGGAVLEGEATREGDKVVIELGSGRITLPADSVLRIDETASLVEQVEARLQKLAPRDVKGLVALADFCRDHDMTARERELLLRVLEVDSNHAEARARLGFVRTEAGWVSRDEQRRDEGLVLYAGQWVTRAQMLELKRLEAETEAARIAREKAALELEERRLALRERREESERVKRERADAERAQREIDRTTVVFAPGIGYAPGVAVCGAGVACGVTPLAPPRAPTPGFGINGVRDPRDTSFAIPGARDPRSYF